MNELVQGDPERVVGLYRGRREVRRPTKRDDASPGSCWRPILSGTKAQQALRAADTIAESIASLPGERGPSLSRGQAGLALLYAWLATTGRAPRADALAWRCLDEAVETAATQTMNASFWGGFTGVAWSADVVGRLLDPGAEDRSEAVDDALLRLLSRTDRWSAPYDLVIGLTGLGVHALQRCPRPIAVECLRLVVERLRGCAREDEHGLYWWTPPAEMDQESRIQYPSGRTDLGVAHGVAGVIALLGGLCGAGVEQAAARPLLEVKSCEVVYDG